MRAFLSHSSKDKDFVEGVAALLRPGTFELDSLTFDAGLINAEAIIRALSRADLFVLFLSTHSVQSHYVEFETLLGVEFYARGGVNKFLAICLDEPSFNQASANVKFFNVVRKCGSVENAARLIQGNLISAAKSRMLQSHPFIGRESDLIELERQVTDHGRPLTKAIFISGNFGSGRRTLARKFYENQYPEVNRIFPIIKVGPFVGLEELYRKLLIALRPSITSSDLKTRAQAFQIAPPDEKRRLIAQLLNSLLPAREASVLFDEGGILTDAGALDQEFNEVVTHLEARPYPPVIIVAPRMIPLRLRRREDDLSYLALRSLNRESSERLISRLLRDRGVSLSDGQMGPLVAHADGHPFNIYRMADEIVERGLDAFLANPRDFIEWKHRQSSEYLNRIRFDENERLVLGLLSIVPELDFQGIATALPIDPGTCSDVLLKLSGLHVVESAMDSFIISPPLRVAVERDHRFDLPDKVRHAAIKSVAETLSIRIEEGTAPIALIDTAVLASLEVGNATTPLTKAFLLPSHYVWLSRRNYDQQYYFESIRLAREALEGRARLSPGGIVAACRFLCLSAARVGDDAIFAEGMTILETLARDDWAKSNIEYLKGFNFRFKGNLPKAEEHFREAYKFSPGNLHAAREVAAICLARGNLDEAENFAREAHSHAARNPYLLDILISVLVRRHGRSARHVPEISELFDALEKVGEEGGRSFFTTRKAEFEHLWGDNKVALELINQAVAKTPNIFEPQMLRAEILLKDGRKSQALEVINTMRDMVDARDPRERRTHYRAYLETFSHYLQEVGRFDEAKAIYNDRSTFTDDERTAAVRSIEILQAYRGH